MFFTSVTDSKLTNLSKTGFDTQVSLHGGVDHLDLPSRCSVSPNKTSTFWSTSKGTSDLNKTYTIRKEERIKKKKKKTPLKKGNRLGRNLKPSCIKQTKVFECRPLVKQRPT